VTTGTHENPDYSLLGEDHVRRYQQRDGDDYLVVASVGGMPTHPAWYLNLVDDPSARIQVRGEHIDVVARTAQADEKPRLWRVVNDVWPNYDTYQERTDRVIPVVVLSPV
jgi:deazaflavin-dependent oxidoreductase (nitroreductase family)